MKITYKREMKHNYMILEPETVQNDSYEIHMMIANCIEGLLKFHVKQVDEKKYFYYEITSRQPLARLLETCSLDADKLRRLILEIARTLNRMESYLLREEQILLEQDYIYVEPGSFRVSLCLVPGLQGNFPEGLSRLLQYLLGKVNHQDKECVVMAYGLYQESLKENYGMEDLLRIVGKERENTEQEKEQDPVSADGFEPDNKAQNPGRIKSSAVGETDSEAEGRNENVQILRRMNTDRTDNQKEKRSAESEETKILQNGRLKRYGGLAAAVTVGLPAAVWLMLGGEAVVRYRYLFLMIDAASAVGFGLLMAGERKEREKAPAVNSPDGNPSVGNPSVMSAWQMEFAEEETEPERGTESEDECQTVLLSGSAAEEKVRYLRSIRHDTEDITLAYFPFLIGKQEGMVDFLLAKDTVSRLHVRIDCAGDEYTVTDLNSTNGTSVAGKHLESNEIVSLHPGEEVYIANFGFIFT